MGVYVLEKLNVPTWVMSRISTQKESACFTTQKTENIYLEYVF